MDSRAAWSEWGAATVSRGFAGLGLFMPKTDVNVGGAIRAAHCYGASLVAIQGQRYWRMPTDTMKSYRHIPVLHGMTDIFEAVPFDCQPVAVDLVEGATSLVDFKHPERAFYIFGPEDGTLGAKVIDRCPHRVMVPTRGCMNLAATVNVILYDRLVKRGSAD